MNTTNKTAVEENVRDFCKHTPRINPESGVAFYERLTKYTEKVTTQAHQQGERESVERCIEVVKERIGQSKLILDELEKGNDMEGGDIQGQTDYEISAKVCLESLLKALLQALVADEEGMRDLLIDKDQQHD